MTHNYTAFVRNSFISDDNTEMVSPVRQTVWTVYCNSNMHSLLRLFFFKAHDENIYIFSFFIYSIYTYI